MTEQSASIIFAAKYFVVIAIDRGSNFPEFAQFWKREDNENHLFDGVNIDKKLNLFESIEYIVNWFESRQKKLEKIEIIFLN
jgi:hypothetical protein